MYSREYYVPLPVAGALCDPFSPTRNTPLSTSDTPHHRFLFTADVDTALRIERAGVNHIIVDWEQNGKHARQNSHETQTNDDSQEAGEVLASRLQIPVTVRVNSLYPETADEVQRALNADASTITLPMATADAEGDRRSSAAAGDASSLDSRDADRDPTRRLPLYMRKAAPTVVVTTGVGFLLMLWDRTERSTRPVGGVGPLEFNSHRSGTSTQNTTDPVDRPLPPGTSHS